MFGGDLIHQVTDEYGNIQIVDYQQKYRSLHFDSKVQQSAMLLEKPEMLVHKYTQAMVLPLCWSNPKKLLLLGLGGGSIAKFILHNFPDIYLDVVELRHKVSELAIHYFCLPQDSAKFHIYNTDVFQWLNDAESFNTYDMIFIDMFISSVNCEIKAIDVSQDLERLRCYLTSNGVIIYNYLGNNIESDCFYQALIRSLEFEIHIIQLENANTIVFAAIKKLKQGLTDSYILKCSIDCTLPFNHYYDRLYKIF